MHTLWLGLALAAAPASAAPASGQPRISAEVIGLEQVTVGRGGIEFEVAVALTHQWGVPLVLRRLDAQIRMGESVVGQIDADQRTRLRRGDSEVVTIPVRISGMSLMSAMVAGEMDLRVDGELKVRAFVLPGEPVGVARPRARPERGSTSLCGDLPGHLSRAMT